MKKLLILFLASATLIAAGTNQVYELTSSVDEEASAKLFHKLCGEDVEQISTQIPKPNYKNQDVLAAAANLNTVAPVSFYMYGAIVKNYGFTRETDPSFPWDLYKEVALDSGRNQSFGMVKNWDTGEETFDEEALKNKFDYMYVHKNPDYQVPANLQDKVKNNSHAFLTYLCGEFRDRPTLIQAKLDWIKNMIKLPVVPPHQQKRIMPSKDLKNIWLKMNSDDYAYYVTISRQVFDAKERELKVDVTLGDYTVDKPVPAFDICEVKYMITEYVTNDRTPFSDYEAYKSGLKSYTAQYCSDEDLAYYYDFRGDSNMKPNSPESNGMIWYATSIMGRCQRDAFGKVSVKAVKEGEEWVDLDFPVEACEKYMKKPFANRWNAARSALATWLGRDIQFDDTFANTNATVNIIPPYSPELSPSSFSLGGGEVYHGKDMDNFLDFFGLNFDKGWVSEDIGMNNALGIGSGEVMQINLSYERLRDAVDRHTDWYSSGYDDSFFEAKRARIIGQAYSPFVASSYEMSESDAFTAPGITVNGPVDGRRQWMYVFKVKKDRWYNTDSMARGEKLDFMKHWFDETSFGTTHLADSERAWDRLGTPLEDEMEAIIYLHNVENNGGAIKSTPNPQYYPKSIDDGLGSTQN